MPYIATRRLCFLILPRQYDARRTTAGGPDLALQSLLCRPLARQIQLSSLFKCRTELVEKEPLTHAVRNIPPHVIMSSFHSSLAETFCHPIDRFAVHTSLGNYSHWNILNAKYFTQVNNIKSSDELFANEKN
jgi:hypothetical protein